MHNAPFWRRYFRSSFQPHLERVLEALEKRVLPAFDDIDAEATALQERTWNDLITGPYDPDVDESMIANAAFEAGYDHYAGMHAVRQSLINSFAPMLYHTWEQQLLAFHRKEVLHPAQEHDNELLTLQELRQRLSAEGLDITKLPSWSAISELRLVANTVKHADGDSADRLKKRRPDLFDWQHAQGHVKMPSTFTRRVYRHMSGEDLYLTLDDLHAYGRATIAFWDEFADALEHG
jgi:hypothetical protein